MQPSFLNDNKNNEEPLNMEIEQKDKENYLYTCDRTKRISYSIKYQRNTKKIEAYFNLQKSVTVNAITVGSKCEIIKVQWETLRTWVRVRMYIYSI